MTSLWGDEFTLKDNTETILAKTKSPKKVKTVEQSLNSKTTSLEDKVSIITENVNRILGGYASNTVVLRSRQELSDYIDKAIQNGVIAVDTETNNSLDPLTCRIMGLCIYTIGEHNAYVPVNHVDFNTRERFDWQVTETDIKEELDRLRDTKIIMHNGKFDYQVIKCTCDCDLSIYWDTMIGAKVLDENENSAGLKQQYIDKIDRSIEKYSIDHLFTIEYAIIDPKLFALYAATDAYMTYRLYEWQKKEFEKATNKKLYELFRNIEMPVVKVVADMELTGVHLDLEYAKRLSQKYHKKYEALKEKLSEELNQYQSIIDEWRKTPKANNRVGGGKSLSEKLESPPNTSSPTQLAILLYDVLKIKPVSAKSPRGTGVEVLKALDLPICKLILEEREMLKLINTYIDKLPTCLSAKDNRLHCHFNQYGAGTGRFSSSDPNLQNIPSHNNEIRMMFSASPGNILIGADYSQQEPRLLSHYSQDENMINAYKEGKDLYAMIASKVYNNNYEDNLEFNPTTGNIQPDGKQRRTSVKSLLLGIMYGMGTNAIAERLNVSKFEAENIKDSFFKEFPNVNKWIIQTQKFAHETGYVEDVWGRRRRLPDIVKNKYEVQSEKLQETFNPLLGTKGLCVDTSAVNNILKSLYNCKWKSQVDEIKSKAKSQGYKVIDNGGYIARAERQCVNARIQGGAASMSKRAMIRVANNNELKSLGFKLLIAVHDELIGECPLENADKCKDILSQEMINAALPEVAVPMKCDADEFTHWYYDVYSSEIKKEYDGDFDKLCRNHIECTPEQLTAILQN